MSLAPHLNDLFRYYAPTERNGHLETAAPGVHFFWGHDAMARAPLLYEAGIIIIGQGHKVGYLEDRVFEYGRDTFLVIGVPIPFECEVFARPDEPLLGLRIDLDMTSLYELVARLDSLNCPVHQHASGSPHTAVEPLRMDTGLLEATTRLARCLLNPLDGKILGPAATEEILYRVLCSPKGRVLYNLTQHNTPYASISRALSQIHNAYNEPISMEDLARETGMSVSSFHRAFKKVTGESPLQYIKKIRLNKARGLLLHAQMQVTEAAFEVGYESPSQFSREYKRYFNVPPSLDLSQAQTAAG